MGAVYVAEQISTGKRRALKLMSPDLVGNPEIRERFVREAKVAANIESDHVVETVTAGVDESSGAPYLVMELLRGEELADAAARTGPLPLEDLKEVFTQIGHALEQAHAQGIVHRDLKPENVFLAISKRRDVPFTAKVLDFGIAKLVADGIQKTGTQPLGSPLYMAPEQTDRKGRVCPATDVWALGLMAFFLLTGQSYWVEADGGSLPGLLREICIDPLVPASQRAAELGVDAKLPLGFDDWFSRCVVRDVDARFPEAGAAMVAFRSLNARDGSTERKLKLLTGLFDDPPTGSFVPGTEATVLVPEPIELTRLAPPSTTGTTGAVSAALPAASRPPNRNVPLAVAGGVGALALITGLGGAVFWQAKPRPSEAPTPGVEASPLGSQPVAAPQPSASSSTAAPASSTCPSGMIEHPKGTTFMGSRSLPDFAGARVDGLKVSLSAFCLDKTEVTTNAYAACVAEGACARADDDVNYSSSMNDRNRELFRSFCNGRKPERGDHPINCVSFKMATTYCSWKGLRLPTEAEWEYAARGKGQNEYPWGMDLPDATRLNAAGSEYKQWGESVSLEVAKTMFEQDDGFVGTAPVGRFPGGASSFGVLDLAGNVWEWVGDWYAPYSPGEVTNPTGPAAGTERVVRGGAFNGWDPSWANPAWRYKLPPERYSHVVGFRCAKSVGG
jgi:formylglycine-generating enzyme required for sulfatase activity/tRNA A-37 threonylcarbamoyl transferase component Bud32